MIHQLYSSQRRERSQERVGIAIGLVGTCLVHGAIALVSALVAWFGPGTSVAVAQARQQLVFVEADLEAPESAAPEPLPEAEPVVPEPPAEPAPIRRDLPPTPLPDEPVEPEPAETEGSEELAEVGATLTVDEETEAFTMVTGDGDRYAGGKSARGGSSKTAVGDSGRPMPEPEPAVVSPAADVAEAPPSVQVVRRPSPKNGDWNMCRFPDLAKDAGLDDGYAKVIVHVSEKGRPLFAQILFESPGGYGFGESAYRCVMRRRYHPARDANGRRVAAETHSFKVRMLRNQGFRGR